MQFREGLSPLTDRSDLDAISVLVALAALYAVLKLGLLPALLAGTAHRTTSALHRSNSVFVSALPTVNSAGQLR